MSKDVEEKRIGPCKPHTLSDQKTVHDDKLFRSNNPRYAAVYRGGSYGLEPLDIHDR